MILKLVRKILRMLSRLTVVLFILFIAAVAAFIWSYVNFQNAKAQLNNAGASAGQMSEKDVAKITHAISKHIVLPEGTPTIAVIQDISALSEQPFFKNAQNGDVVVVYSQQALIYSPKRDVLVNVGPVVNNGETTDKGTPAASTTTDVTVEVRNGSTTLGLAGTVGDDIDEIEGYAVSTTTNAKDKNYNQTIIVNLKAKDVSALEKKFGVIAVTTLPAGESATQADVVVILGNK